MFSNIASVLFFMVLMLLSGSIIGLGIWALIMERNDAKKKRKHAR